MRARRARWRRRTYPHEAHDDERLEVEKDGHVRARLAHAHQVARDHLRFQVQVAVGALCVDDDHEDAAGHGADDGLLGVDVRSGNQALEGPAGSVGKAPDRDEGASGAAAYLALATADEAVVGDDRAKVHSDFGRSENERAGRCVDDRVGCKRGGGREGKKIAVAGQNGTSKCVRPRAVTSISRFHGSRGRPVVCNEEKRASGHVPVVRDAPLDAARSAIACA